MDNFFASNLKYLRKLNKMTQLDLAKKMDKDYSTIGKWELNQRTPIMEDIMKIADIFNISILELINTDLRFEKENNNSTNDNNHHLHVLTMLFRSRGLLEHHEHLLEEDLERIIKFIKANKKFIIIRKED